MYHVHLHNLSRSLLVHIILTLTHTLQLFYCMCSQERHVTLTHRHLSSGSQCCNTSVYHHHCYGNLYCIFTLFIPGASTTQSNENSNSNVEAYQMAFGVVVPVLIVIIIAGVVFYIVKHHPLKLGTSTTKENVSPIYENQELSNVAQQNMENQANALDPTYDHIDPADICIGTNLYDGIETDRVEYANVH